MKPQVDAHHCHSLVLYITKEKRAHYLIVGKHVPGAETSLSSGVLPPSWLGPNCGFPLPVRHCPSYREALYASIHRVMYLMHRDKPRRLLLPPATD